MINNIKYLVIGLTVGLAISSSLSYADNIKEYICSKVGYKIMVNGSEFKSDKVILNYNGSTYLPLKAIGDSLNVDIKWDDKLKQVNIGNVITKDNVNEVKPMSGGDLGEDKGIPTPIDNKVSDKVVTNINDLSYEHFKANFKVGELSASGNRLITKVKYNGNLNESDFYTWWNSINKELYVKNTSDEIYSKNPKIHLIVLFLYKTNNLCDYDIANDGYVNVNFHHKQENIKFVK